MSEPFAWTGEEQETASRYDPRVQEQMDEYFRRQDEAWAEEVARQARPHD